MPYVAPEVLRGGVYTLSSDIYSFGVIMTEVTTGKPPFYNKEYDINLALAICDGLRPEFGKGAPEIYKKLAYPKPVNSSIINSYINNEESNKGILLFLRFHFV